MKTPYDPKEDLIRYLLVHNNDKVFRWKERLCEILMYKNEILLNIICIFCEWYTNQYKDSICDKLIANLDLATQKIEKLSLHLHNTISMTEIVEVFGIEFAKYFNLEEFRNNQLNILWRN